MKRELPQEFQAVVRLGYNTEEECWAILDRRHPRSVMVRTADPDFAETVFYQQELTQGRMINGITAGRTQQIERHIQSEL